MLMLTAAEGEEILIDGHIRVHILAIHPDEVCLEINFPECLRSDNDHATGQPNRSSRWPASSA